MLGLYLLAAVAISSVTAYERPLCDDGAPGNGNLSGTVNCEAPGILALQAGCYVCVDATTGLRLAATPAHNGQESAKTSTLSKANSNDISIIFNDQADGTPDEDVAFEQDAVVTDAYQGVAEVDGDKSEHVSNWLFVMPATLAIVSLGIAIHRHVPTRRRGFRRLEDRHSHDTDPLFQDNINPFCTNTDADLEVETAGHFQGEESPETEEDELAEAEAEAIKQAVLLHIKEFDDEENNVEV